MNPMLRCALLATVLVASAPAFAQVARSFPADTLRGDLQVQAFPEVLLNSKPARMAPGAVIRGENNLVQLPGELTGKRVLVHYRMEETSGLIRDVWILNAPERANRVWPNSRQQAALWKFDAATQTWSKP
ncbi:MAG: hypothetical protein ACK5O3_05590 [Burkholderiales bacterium]|jgi:hypothetical protein